jgi:general secretion pathway protein A
MYNVFFGFNAKPFNISPDPDNLYMSPNHQSALTHLEYGLIDQIGLMVLTGEVGTGKTTLIRYITDHFCGDKQLAVINQTNVSASEFFRQIISAFNIKTKNDHNETQLQAFKRFLKQKQADQKQALIIVDEAQGLVDETLEEVRLLTNVQMDFPDAMQIMLIGQPELLDRLGTNQWVSLGQRIGISYHLKALDLEQTCQYIAHRLTKVGGHPKLFSKEAQQQVYQSSEGIPRLINLICDAALVYAFGDELETIEGPLIAAVVKERAGMGLRTQLEAYSRNKPGPAATNGNGHYEERLNKLEAGLEKIRHQIEFHQEDLTILNTSSKDDLFIAVKRIVAKERLLRRHMENEIQQLKRLLKKSGLPHPDNPMPVSQPAIAPYPRRSGVKRSELPGKSNTKNTITTVR